MVFFSGISDFWSLLLGYKLQCPHYRFCQGDYPNKQCISSSGCSLCQKHRYAMSMNFFFYIKLSHQVNQRVWRLPFKVLQKIVATAIIILLFVSPLFIFGQFSLDSKRDYNWVFGIRDIPPSCGRSIVNFYTTPITTSYTTLGPDIGITNSSISDNDGLSLIHI